jgi:MFS family permease
MKLHRGWLNLLITVFTLVACLGLGRFSLGAIIPFMKQGLDLNYREMGWVASAVFVGYLIMVAVAGHLVLRFTAKKVIVTSLFVIVLGMLGNANATGFWTAFLSCLIVGIGSGGANIPALGVLAQWFTQQKRGMAMGAAYSGVGIGFVLSGLIIPSLVTLSPSMGWRTSWYVLAGIILLITLIHLLFLKNSPQEVGLKPIGYSEQMEEKTTKPAAAPADDSKESVYKNKNIRMIGFIYLTWGFSYILFSTFLVDYLMEEVGFGKQLAGQYFAVIGLVSIVSGFIWGIISDRLGRVLTLGIVYIGQSFLLVFLSLSVQPILILLQVILFAVTLWAVPTIMAAAVSDLVGLHQAAVAMGYITLFFGVGQFVAPIINGYLLDWTHSYLSAFLLSAFICFLGGIGCLRLFQVQKRNAVSHEISA